MLAEQLRRAVDERLVYDREGGQFLRRAGFTGVTPGSRLGTPGNGGSLQAFFLGKSYQVSHLVWLMETGELPAARVTFANGDRTDCRFSNLRVLDGCIACETHGRVKRSKRGQCPQCGVEQGRLNAAQAAREAAQARHADPEQLALRAAKKAARNRRQSEKRKTDPVAKAKQNGRILAWHKRKKATDPAFAAAVVVRQVLARVIASAKVEAHASRVSDTCGYTVAEFKQHIEAQFEPWMNWANHGEWHVDHIKPLATFLREGECDPRVINALSNLRPLRARENLLRRFHSEQIGSVQGVRRLCG